MDAVQKTQQAVAFAALLIHECGKEITVDAIKAVLNAAGVAITGWVEIFAKAFTTEKVGQLLDTFANSAPAAAAAPVAAAAVTEEAPKEEEKKEEEEEEDDFGGFGDLF